MKRWIQSHAGHRELFLALTLMILLSPLLDDTHLGRTLSMVALTLILWAGARAMGTRRRVLRVTTLAAAVILFFAIFIVHSRTTTAYPIVVAIQMLFTLGVTISVGDHVFKPGRVDADNIWGGASIFLLLGILWAQAYILLELLAPNSFVHAKGASFNMMHSVYFSFVTLTTLGYGEWVPDSDAARTLAILEAIVGVMYVAVIVARLVSAYDTPSSAGERLEDETMG